MEANHKWHLPCEKCILRLLQDLYEANEENPIQPSLPTKQLLKEVWKNKSIIPIVQTSVWSFLCRALLTGARAGKFSKHITKLCCRCGLEEDDTHLFFTYPYVQVVWFLHLWFIRTELIVQNYNSLPHIILTLLNLSHQNDTL